MAIDPNGTIGPAEPPVGGSIFTIGNTTYSGCDIKVVVNIYDGGAGVAEEIKEIAHSIQTTERDIRNAADSLGPATKKLNRLPRGTTEFRLAAADANRYLELIALRQDTLTDLQQRHDQLVLLKGTVATKALAEVQTLSATVSRDKHAVRACGTVYPKAFTRGPREIAGSIVFTVFNEHVLYEILDAHASDFDGIAFTSILMDQLPPLDILISFANEYGSISRMTIYGVEFVNEGQVMSIEDMITEQVVTWVARDIDPMRSVSKRKLDETSRKLGSEVGLRASDLILEKDYQEQRDKLSPFQRFNKRRDPFL